MQSTGKKALDYQNIKDELLSTVDTGIKCARTVDAEAEFEIYLFQRNVARATVEQGVVDAADGIVEGNAVRAAKRNNVSFASSSGISTERLKRSIEEAIASIRSVNIRDERFKGFCEPKKPGNEGAFADEILQLDKERLIEYADTLVKDGRAFDKRILTAGSSCTAEWGGFAIGNTQGLQQASRSVSNTCNVQCLATEGDERRVAYEYDITRERLIRIEGMGRKAAEKAVSLLGARRLDRTAVLPTIWEPISAASYVYSSLGQSVRGEHVVEGRSPLAGKIGKEVANRHLTITDDGQDPSSISTEAVDDEGQPQQTSVIIRSGRLVQFLFDNYYAGIYGAQSTGNASRGGGPFASALPYEATLQIRPKYLKVEPGRKSLDDIISSVDGQAVLIVDAPIGIFHSSVSTGEFSSVAQSSFLVENGERKCPLHPVSVSGNFYTGFRQLLSVGTDLEMTPFTVETPSIVFDGFSIVG